MPADYKYEHISTGRLKSLKMASLQLNRLYRELAGAEVLAPRVIERLRDIKVLLGHGAGPPMDSGDVELLENLIGENFDEEKK